MAALFQTGRPFSGSVQFVTIMLSKNEYEEEMIKYYKQIFPHNYAGLHYKFAMRTQQLQLVL